MKKLLTNIQLESLRAHISEKLRVRCIFVTLTVKEVSDASGRKQRIQLSSTKFNTIPVIHSEIEIQDSGSSVEVDPENKNIINVFVRVSARYEGNGETLFSFSGSFSKTRDEFYPENN